MKINIADKATGCQKTLDFDDENKVRPFFEKKIGQEVPADSLGEEFKGYTLKITGGADKQGFGMKQGVLTNTRVRLLLDGRTGGLRRPTHDGERKRRTVRGCIVGNDLAVINCVIAKKGPAELPGLTEKTLPRRLGPKRASKIRKLFNLSKEDDVRKFVIRRTSQRKKVTEGKPATRSKAPKIQRLVTSATLHRKHRRTAQKLAALAKSRALKAEYEKLLADRKVEAKEKRAEAVKAKKAAAKAAVAGVAKRQTAVAMKKMKRRANYVLKTKAKIALRQRKPLVGKDARAQAKKAKRAAVLKRRVILKNRKIVLQKCIAARKAVCKDIEAEREQNKKYPSKLCRHRIAKLRAKAHELYLRIMSGGRLANIRQTEKAAARRVARLTKKAVKGQPAAKKAKK